MSRKAPPARADSRAPVRPAATPLARNARAITRLAGTPASSAARRFCPTADNARPKTVRLSTKAASAVTARAASTITGTLAILPVVNHASAGLTR